MSAGDVKIKNQKPLRELFPLIIKMFLKSFFQQRVMLLSDNILLEQFFNDIFEEK